VAKNGVEPFLYWPAEPPWRGQLEMAYSWSAGPQDSCENSMMWSRSERRFEWPERWV